jgi:hypothetical protein
MRRSGGLRFAALLLVAGGDDGSDEGVHVREKTEATTAPMTADAIPVAHTPEGGWHGAMPAPVLADCTEPVVEGAPDLRGLWQAVEVEVGGEVVPNHPALRHVERVEQCGDRVVVTGGGVIHDMRVDGTEANGVNDVAQADFTTRLTVVAAYEEGVHVLRPVGLPVEITRHREGAQMVWQYVGFTARLDRIGESTDPYPPPEEAP